MRTLLLWVIGLECLLLMGGLGLHAAGKLEAFQRPPLPLSAFTPPIHDARIGDLVRYEKRHRTTGETLGYLDYEVLQVFVTKGTTAGPDIVLAIRETDARGERKRVVHVQPRALTKGFLPPRFENEDDYPAGERPVVSRISTATFRLQEPVGAPVERAGSPKPLPAPVRGFLVEAVIPRQSLTEVAERYWMTTEVAVFGVARWERGDEVLVLHRQEKPPRLATEENQ